MKIMFLNIIIYNGLFQKNISRDEKQPRLSEVNRSLKIYPFVKRSYCNIHFNVITYVI